MTSLARLEIEREEETSTLFRGASLTTALMDLYMKSVCQDFLHTALFPTIHRYKVNIKVLTIKSSYRYWIFLSYHNWTMERAQIFHPLSYPVLRPLHFFNFTSWNYNYVFYCFRILETKQSCELNPNMIESPTEACSNAEFLLQVTKYTKY